MVDGRQTIRGCVVEGHDVGHQGVAFDDTDDVALVDVKTDATASVLSPNVWIRRPRKALTPMRSPDGTSKMYHDENVRGDSATPLKKGKEHVAKTPTQKRRRQDTREEEDDVLKEEEGMYVAPAKLVQIECGVEGKRKRKKSTKLQNSDFLVDEQEYTAAVGNSEYRKRIDVAGDIQKALEEHDRAEADLKDISDMEHDIAKTRELIMALEQMFASKTRHLEEVHAQNTTIKRIFGSISVIRDDFVTDGLSDDQRREKMLRIGRRLVHHLRTTPSQGPCQPAQDGAVPQGRQASSGQHALPMVAPEMHPMESQIAAAALIAAKGDPARALVSLFEKGLEARRKSS